MKSAFFPKKILSLVATALSLTCITATAQELSPDDPSIVGNLGAWFKDAAATFDPITGIWTDSSGNDKPAIPVGEVNVNGPVTFLPPTLTTVSGGAFSTDEVASVHFASDAEDILAANQINNNNNLTSLTIFAVINVDPLGTDASLARPVGIGSVAATQFNAGDNFNLGSDPSIRKDNGSVGANGYSAPFPLATTLIRTARMSPTNIDEWFNVTGTAVKTLSLTGVSYTTSSDDFFMGDLRAGFSPVPGVFGSGTSRANIDIVQALVYHTALTDAQVLGVNQWLTNNITGATSGSILEFTNITTSPDSSIVSLTWRSKPGKTYAVDLSYDLNADWQEIADEVLSKGADTTSFDAPPFIGPAPDPLPTRVFYRVREI